MPGEHCPGQKVEMSFSTYAPSTSGSIASGGKTVTDAFLFGRASALPERQSVSRRLRLRFEIVGMGFVDF